MSDISQKRIKPTDISIDVRDVIPDRIPGQSSKFIAQRVSAIVTVGAWADVSLEELSAAQFDVIEFTKRKLRRQVMDDIYGDLKTFARQARGEFMRTTPGTSIGDDHPGIQLLDALLKLGEEESDEAARRASGTVP